MGLRPDYDLLHAVGRGVAWQVDEFKPQVGGKGVGGGGLSSGAGDSGAAAPGAAVSRMVYASPRADSTPPPTHTPPKGLANIVWGLGKMGVKVTHEVRAMVDCLGRELAAQLTHARHKGERGVRGCGEAGRQRGC
jgi:hypothetical protein